MVDGIPFGATDPPGSNKQTKAYLTMCAYVCLCACYIYVRMCIISYILFPSIGCPFQADTSMNGVTSCGNQLSAPGC